MEPIKCDDTIMLAVFRRFLKNPRPFAFNLGSSGDEGKALESYLPHEECPVPGDCTAVQWHRILRWHVFALISEFVIHGTLIGNPTPRIPENPLNYLNWSGKKLYEKLSKSEERAICEE